jgi:hypothetical protein
MRISCWQWGQSDKDTFGVAISRESEENKKIRIHLTAHKGIPPKEAVQRSAKKIDEIRKEKGHRHKQVMSCTSIETATGITGQKAIVAQQGIGGPPYLNRDPLSGQTDVYVAFACIITATPYSQPTARN